MRDGAKSNYHLSNGVPLRGTSDTIFALGISIFSFIALVISEVTKVVALTISDLAEQ